MPRTIGVMLWSVNRLKINKQVVKIKIKTTPLSPPKDRNNAKILLLLRSNGWEETYKLSFHYYLARITPNILLWIL